MQRNRIWIDIYSLEIQPNQKLLQTLLYIAIGDWLNGVGNFDLRILNKEEKKTEHKINGKAVLPLLPVTPTCHQKKRKTLLIITYPPENFPRL